MKDPQTLGASSGAERRRRAQGRVLTHCRPSSPKVDPGLASFADGFIFGDVWGRPGLTFEERMMVAITALAATGHPTQLKNYLHGALQDGDARVEDP